MRYFKFLLGRYAEFAILAIIPFWLAYEIEPSEYSKLLFATILFQLSSFVTSISGTTYLKLKVDGKNFGEGTAILMIVSVVAIVSFSIYQGNYDVIVYLSCMAALGNVFRGGYQNYLRGNDRIDSLSKFNAIYPSFFLLAYIFLREEYDVSVVIYLISQCIGLLASSLYAFYIVNRFGFLKLSMIFKGASQVRMRYRTLVNITLINMFGYIMLQSDKVYLSYIDIDESIKGKYLFLDNIGNILYFSVASIGFAISPYLMKQIKDTSGQLFFRHLSYWSGLVLISSITFFFFVEFVVFSIFHVYEISNELLFSVTLVKSMILVQFIPQTYLLTVGKERLIMISQLASCSGFIFMLFNYNGSYIQYVFTLSLSSMLCVVFMIAGIYKNKVPKNA
ncbi:hypothetical protein QNE86_002092 [Vibrio vulnificus]|nr:hypothetical protein [Vibrio vulnificus]